MPVSNTIPFEKHLPSWVLECVSNPVVPPREEKLSFSLLPHPPEKDKSKTLPAILPDNSMFTANQTIAILKVQSFVVNQLQELDKKENTTRFANIEVEIICKEAVVPPHHSLITVQKCLWKNSKTMVLTYREVSA
eukprot:c6774_g1_i2.p1 GENE.c6774_g1_i2~~c6774_g1_i2.p1  ORF type:complete len:135 (-),score=32.87 c6774_g1_i2:48-452(-)